MKKEIPKSESKYLKLSSSSTHFFFYYSKSLEEDLLEKIKKTLESNYKKVRRFFREKTLPIISVNIYPNKNKMLDECLGIDGKKHPSWVFSLGAKDWISIIDPSKVPSYCTYDYISILMAHELVHSFTLLDNMDRPRWLIEGVADYVADKNRYLKFKEFVEDLKNFKFPNIVKLAKSPANEFYEKQGYPFSVTIIAFIIREFGKEKLLEILKNPKKSVYKILNKSEKKFQTEWEEYLKRVYYKKVQKYFSLL